MTELIDAATMAELTALDESAMEVGAITIKDYVTVSDGAGSSTTTDTTRVVNGMFWTVGGDEAGEEQVKVRGKYRVDIPADVVVSPTARIIYKGVTYAVKFPFPIGTYDVSRIIGLEDA